MGRKTYDVAWGLEKGYTPQEIADYVKAEGLEADTSGVPAWRARQREAAMASGAQQLQAGSAQVAPSAPAESTNQPRLPDIPTEASHWTDPIPSVLGVGGGLLGSLAGPWGALAGAGAFQGLGKAANLKARQAAGLPSPSGPDAMREIGREAGMGVLSEATGRAVNAGVGLAGRGLMTRAMNDPVAARTAMRTRATVGEKWGPWSSAEDIGRQGMDAAGARIERLLSAGEALNLKANTSGFQTVLEERLAKAAANKTSNPAAFQYWKNRLARWKAQGPEIPVRDLQNIKELNAREAKRIYEARQVAGASPQISLDEEYSRDLADWARNELEALLPGQGGKGIRQANADYEEFRRMRKANDSVTNPKPGRVPAEAAPQHTRVYGHSVSLLPQLPPDVASRLALLMSSAPTQFGIRALPWAADIGMSTGIARNYQPRPKPSAGSLGDVLGPQ